MAPGFESLPVGSLTKILLGAHKTLAPHELPVRAAIVAQVHPDWQAVVRDSPLYCWRSDLSPRQRCRLLVLVTTALKRAQGSGVLTFDRPGAKKRERIIGAAGAELLAAALSASSPLPLAELRLRGCGLGAESLALLAPALASALVYRPDVRGDDGASADGDGANNTSAEATALPPDRLGVLDLSLNPLGDAGATDGLAPLLRGPASSIEALRIQEVGFSAVGMAAVAAQLPPTLAALDCRDNDGVEAPELGPVLRGLEKLRHVKPTSLEKHVPLVLAARRTGGRGLGKGDIGTSQEHTLLLSLVVAAGEHRIGRRLFYSTICKALRMADIGTTNKVRSAIAQGTSVSTQAVPRSSCSWTALRPISGSRLSIPWPIWFLSSAADRRLFRRSSALLACEATNPCSLQLRGGLSSNGSIPRRRRKATP
jgi:hypothetical protein